MTASTTAKITGLKSVAWLDMFDIQVFPVTTYEEGLEKLTRHLAGE